MNILICNDDGIESEGIIALAKSLLKEHNVLVVAPQENRSAYAHSLTIYRDLNLKKTSCREYDAYALSGTPCDCVKFAMHELKDFQPDLVCAGINVGHNLGSDVVYSGTVSIGLEANYFRLPSIAFSSTSYVDNDMKMCAEIALKMINQLKDKLSSEFTLNVNIPHLKIDEIRGVKFTKLGRQIYSDNYISDRAGYYKLVGEALIHDENDADCDVEWNRLGYITITPILYDKTDYATLKRINGEIDFK